MQAKKLLIRIAVLSVLGVALSMTAYNTSVKANAHLESERAAAPEASAEEASNAPYDFEEIMQKGHRDDRRAGTQSLVTKVKEGTATDTEKKQLLGYYLALEMLEAPQGDQAEWQERTAALTSALINVMAGLPDGISQLDSASNCKACHDVHRPD